MNRQEAINIVKKNWPDSSFTSLKEALEFLIPELMNTDDEKIKEAIIKGIIHAAEEGCFCADNYNVKECVAWLEKQGEHAKFRDSIQVGDKVTRNQDGILVNLSQLKRVAKKDEKQGEQKPAWSEEDERNLDWLITVCERIHYKSDPQVSPKGALVLKDWLKSLKDRYTWKPSEEQITSLARATNRCVSIDDAKILIKLLEQLKALL